VRHFQSGPGDAAPASEGAFLVANSSDAIKEEGIDAQFTLMNAWPERCECFMYGASESILFLCRFRP